MSAISTTVTFDRMVALAGLREWWFSDVAVEMTPVIEDGMGGRWPDEGDIAMSWRGPDKLRWFQLRFPPQVANDLFELCWDHENPRELRLVELDGWTQHHVDEPASWSWRPPFYKRAYRGPDPKWPWIHWFYTIQWDGHSFRSVPVDRTVTVDDGQPITTHTGFFYTKHGPG